MYIRINISICLLELVVYLSYNDCIGGEHVFEFIVSRPLPPVVFRKHSMLFVYYFVKILDRSMMMG